jgi:DNA-binding transcriptional LysR family regulator
MSPYDLTHPPELTADVVLGLPAGGPDAAEIAEALCAALEDGGTARSGACLREAVGNQEGVALLRHFLARSTLTCPSGGHVPPAAWWAEPDHSPASPRSSPKCRNSLVLRRPFRSKWIGITSTRRPS